MAFSEPYQEPLYRPPVPRPLPAVPALFRSLITGDRDLLGLIPAEAYKLRLGKMGFSRRKIVLVNEPAILSELLGPRAEGFPKNDLFVGSLEPLIRDGMFISDGTTWARQRRMIAPAFSHIQVNRAFDTMVAALDDFEKWMDERAVDGEPFSLDQAITHVTADIICRAIVSKSLENEDARQIFKAFGHFQETVATVTLTRLILGRPFEKVSHPSSVLDAAAGMRRIFRQWLKERQEIRDAPQNDILGDIIAALDPQDGSGFSADELVDEIGVFFLAGHETTANAVTWALYILAQQPHVTARIVTEVESVLADGPLNLSAVKRLNFTRAVFREVLRLYPPLPFLPRVAAEPTKLGHMKLPRGAMVMVAPWITHRHSDFWKNPQQFDPDRFMPGREGEIQAGTYLPFGMGQRICVGAAFALIEGPLLLARLLNRYNFDIVAPETVRPMVRLATRPREPIMATAEHRL